MKQLSKHQWALLGVLLLHPHSIDELSERWRYALRTVRGCLRAGLVRTYGESGQWVEITDAGRQYFNAPSSMGTWARVQ